MEWVKRHLFIAPRVLLAEEAGALFTSCTSDWHDDGDDDDDDDDD